MNGVDASDTSMDSLYRRRIPTGHVSFDELYVKFFGDIPEEQNSRMLQNESFESLYRKYHNDNAEDISRQCMYDDLYVKYADELQVFGGGDDSIDFVYTLIDNSLNDIVPSPHRKTNSQISQEGNDTYTQQKIDDSLIPPPVTMPPLKEELTFSDKSNQRSTNPCSYSPKKPIKQIKQIPEKIQTRSSARLNSSSSTKIPKINNTNNAPRRNDNESNVNDSPTLITPTNKLQTTISEVVVDTLKYTYNSNRNNNFRESSGAKKFSLTNHFGEDDDGDPPKKKAKLNRSKKKT